MAWEDLKMDTKIKILTLSLCKEWFDMIKSGKKTEEYREITPYWACRLIKYNRMEKQSQAFWSERLRSIKSLGKLQSLIGKWWYQCSPIHFDKIVFTCGYPSKDDTDRIMTFNAPSVRIGEGNPEWGAESGKLYFIITWQEE